LKQTETLLGIEDKGGFCDPPNAICMISMPTSKAVNQLKNIEQLQRTRIPKLMSKNPLVDLDLISLRPLFLFRSSPVVLISQITLSST
jgi:hypothetical protein